MTETPNFIAQTPDLPHLDALSEVLSAVRFTGGHLEAHRTRPEQGPVRITGGRSLLIIRSGSLLFSSAEIGGPILLRAGDVVLLAFGSGFTIAPDDPPRGADAVCDWLRCTFDLDPRLGQRLLVCLPRVIVLHHVSGRAMDWLEAGSAFALAEARSSEPGAAVMVARLVEVLLIRVLRLWAIDPAAPSSWLVGATDPAIGRVLGDMHSAPEMRWTVPDLARRAAMSRSAFARRFGEMVGQPPLRYLIGLRMDKAAGLLQDGSRSIADLADAVGYESEPAFSRAFKLRFGQSPSHWRRR